MTGQIRLTTGYCRGMKLLSPKGFETRPTHAKIRAAVWNKLQAEVNGGRILDLFAGTGAIGIEGLSRGGDVGVFVESEARAFTCLRSNLEECRARAVKAGINALVIQAIKSEMKNANGPSGWVTQAVRFGPFDIIWADPPYKDAQYWSEFLRRELEPLVHADTVLVFERGCDKQISEKISGSVSGSVFADKAWEVFDTKNYGNTAVDFWRRKGH